MDFDRALAWSHYAQRALAAEPALRSELLTTVEAPFDWTAAARSLATVTAGDDAPAFAAELRRLRRRLFLHTLFRDLTDRADLDEVVGAVTRLAEIAIEAAVGFHARQLAVMSGDPIGMESGTVQPLIVIGMGKLGGRELNVSSDVDLVFVYPEEGDTQGPRSIANRQFFDRLGRSVINALNHVTADGYVFRVDMRLRPYGQSGALTASFTALEHYLVAQGRAWERYAWLKARPLTGDCDDELARRITPFVYRKYLDYDAYEELREIHRQIREQERRGRYANDIKLGPGGIREIEFIAQALQIVRGGKEPELRVRGTQHALDALAERGSLPQSASDALKDAYRFLRRVEHRLQYRDDRQTQQLPYDGNERAQLAESLGHADRATFERALALHRGNVEAQFAMVLGESRSPSGGNDDDSAFRRAWEDPSAAVIPFLALRGFRDAETLIATLQRARSGTRYAQLPALSRQRFDRLVPMLLQVAAEHGTPDADAHAVFLRLFKLLEEVSRRSAYLALFVEHPPLLPRLAHLMAASAWAADYLTRHPILLDELLDTRALFAEPDWQAWRDELSRVLAAHDDDAERKMDALRHFQQAQTLRLLLQDLGGTLSVERLADHLSALADTLLDATLAQCWAQLSANGPMPRFAIIGYGKLGGKELGYASDLDIVFLYDVDADSPDADRAVERYGRLAQRLNTWLTSTTAAGRLYDTDLRLRPDGAAGLLVSSISAFRRYQRETAWTWEHQALTRARFVAGDAALGAAFEAERIAILRMPRDVARLATDVIEMRRKMQAGHPNRTDAFDLKHDAGGMVDIEFIVQFLVLAHAHRHPELVRNVGNIALLHIAGTLGLIPAALASQAADAYREYRRLQHKVRLTGAPHARVGAQAQADRRDTVRTLWQRAFGIDR
jgi:glutamate-ammonia-ligase adenylyltransferase